MKHLLLTLMLLALSIANESSPQELSVISKTIVSLKTATPQQLQDEYATLLAWTHSVAQKVKTFTDKDFTTVVAEQGKKTLYHLGNGVFSTRSDLTIDVNDIGYVDNAFIAVDGNCKISFVANSVVICTGDIDIAHSQNNLIFSNGYVEISHDGSVGHGSIIYSPGYADVSHSNGSVFLFLKYMEVSHLHDAHCINTGNMEASHGSCIHFNDPLWKENTVATRRHVENTQAVNISDNEKKEIFSKPDVVAQKFCEAFRNFDFNTARKYLHPTSYKLFDKKASRIQSSDAKLKKRLSTWTCKVGDTRLMKDVAKIYIQGPKELTVIKEVDLWFVKL